MFKHILVPVDGSETSLHAVAKAAGLAKAFGSEVTAVYVLDPIPSPAWAPTFAYGQAQYLSAATAEANTALEAVRSNGRSRRGREDHGGRRPRGARRHRARGRFRGRRPDRHGLARPPRPGKLVLGSVAQRVLSAARIPVLVVRQ
jgi:nucleotide-binding universal stress UspA family protein